MCIIVSKKFQYHVLGSESEKTLILKEILSSFLWTGILLFVFLFVFFIRKVKANENLKDLGFIKHRSFAKDIWYGIVGFALIYVITLPFFIAILPERAKISKRNIL